MNTREYLLACVSEECGEVIQAIGKAQRFGMESSHPKYGDIKNRELISNEINDILATLQLLNLEYLTYTSNAKHRKKKRLKLIKRMEESRKLGILE